MVNGENEWTRGILKQVHRLSNLINHLILLSKMGEGSQFQMQKALVNISEVAANTAGSFRLLAEEQHKKVEADVEKDVRIQTDEKCFLELLNIFLDNAVKYCDEGGTVRLRCGKERKTAPWHWLSAMTMRRGNTRIIPASLNGSTEAMSRITVQKPAMVSVCPWPRKSWPC